MRFRLRGRSPARDAWARSSEVLNESPEIACPSLDFLQPHVVELLKPNDPALELIELLEELGDRMLTSPVNGTVSSTINGTVRGPTTDKGRTNRFHTT